MATKPTVETSEPVKALSPAQREILKVIVEHPQGVSPQHAASMAGQRLPGAWSDLDAMISAGLIERPKADKYFPTDAGRARYAADKASVR